MFNFLRRIKLLRMVRYTYLRNGRLTVVRRYRIAVLPRYALLRRGFVVTVYY